jgi:hypothetical protein
MIGFPFYPKETREKKKEVEGEKCSLGRNYKKQKKQKSNQGFTEKRRRISENPRIHMQG